MNLEIATLAPQFLLWEYLFQIFGIGSLQCGSSTSCWEETTRRICEPWSIHNHHQHGVVAAVASKPSTANRIG